MRVLVSVIGVAVAAAIAGLAVVYAGIYNVAASYPHSAFTNWLLHTAMKQSVRRHARAVAPPPAELPALADKGARIFGEMCVSCHGAPGVEPAAVGTGLTPPAADLTQAAPEWSAQEIFWIVKHGVRFTGMPAWGASHGDDELWALTAFVKTLPSLSPEAYQAMTKE